MFEHSACGSSSNSFPGTRQMLMNKKKKKKKTMYDPFNFLEVEVFYLLEKNPNNS